MRAFFLCLHEISDEYILGGSGGYAAQTARTRPLADPGRRQVGRLSARWQKLGNVSAADAVAAECRQTRLYKYRKALTALMPVLDIDIKDARGGRSCRAPGPLSVQRHGKILTRVGKRAEACDPVPDREDVQEDCRRSGGRRTATLARRSNYSAKANKSSWMASHPDTGSLYKWFGGDLTEVTRYDLPHLNEAEARDLVQDVVALLVSEHGYKLARISTESERPWSR